MSQPSHGETAPLDLRERGAQRDGQPQLLDRRLFMQLLVFSCPGNPLECTAVLGRALAASGIGAVLYEDVNDPFGVGVLTFSDEPLDFVNKVRPALAVPELRGITLRPEFTMLGRSY